MSPSTVTRDNRQFAAEIKFLLTPALAAQVRDWARSRLAADPHAGGEQGDGYSITSLYLDTDAFAVFCRRGSYQRSKMRVRRYGWEGPLFLERKLKTRGLLAKRRARVVLSDLARLDGTVHRDWPGFWFHRRLQLRRLRPVCQITYERTARVAMTDHGPIRLTLDEGLRAVPVSGFAFETQPGAKILENCVILELKFLFQMPILFKDLVGEFCLNPTRFSKYRQAAAQLGLVERQVSSRDTLSPSPRAPVYA